MTTSAYSQGKVYSMVLVRGVQETGWLHHLQRHSQSGRVLGVVTDCSHSGSWVRECMAFMVERRVKPCGHSARDKALLVAITASCLSHQVPRQFAISVHGCKNDKNTGLLVMYSSPTVIPVS